MTNPFPHHDTLRDDYVLIKTVAVALNPIDWMRIDSFPAAGAMQGSDFSGNVQQVGKAVKANFEPGDRICVFTRGGDYMQLENGAFGQYIVAKADVLFHIPGPVSFEDAASFGLGAHTAGMGLYQKLGLRHPVNDESGNGDYLLIYGGSTASAALGIQLAVL
jgi:NADPH:quinone reductase-like Zn-dependent oxidoreductase